MILALDPLEVHLIVDLATGKLVVRQNIVSGVTGTPKSGKAREVPWTKAMVARLKAVGWGTRAPGGAVKFTMFAWHAHQESGGYTALGCQPMELR